jgi:hypothetical protein
LYRLLLLCYQKKEVRRRHIFAHRYKFHSNFGVLCVLAVPFVVLVRKQSRGASRRHTMLFPAAGIERGCYHDT